VNGAPRGKGADGDLDQLRADLGQAEAALGDARSSLSSGNFNAALEQAKSADSKLNQVQSDVQVAMKKIDDWKMKNRPWFEL
jgi:multidrug resistance efflux pump